MGGEGMEMVVSTVMPMVPMESVTTVRPVPTATSG
jgi:hypothetical protein